MVQRATFALRLCCRIFLNSLPLFPALVSSPVVSPDKPMRFYDELYSIDVEDKSRPGDVDGRFTITQNVSRLFSFILRISDGYIVINTRCLVFQHETILTCIS